MFMAQQYVGQYRRKRLLIAVVIASIVLSLTLAFRYFEEKSYVQQRAISFADNAITRFDRMFSPLDVSANNMQGLVGMSCPDARFPLIEKISSLQTVRAILLVEEDRLYCSSIFGSRDISFSQTYPELALNEKRMLLSTDDYLLKGSPVLLLWTPTTLDNRSGILQAINIELMSSYLLEPQAPWVERAIFNVNGKSLEYGNPLIESTLPSEDEVTYTEASLRYPYTVTLYGPSPSRLALASLPSQLPLALMLSLLIGYVVWLATANRMSLSWQISYGITALSLIHI